MTWTPQSKKPRNGSRILVWVDLRGEHVNDRSHADVACYDAKRGFVHGHCGPRFDPQPTHWQSLPVGPFAAEEYEKARNQSQGPVVGPKMTF